MCCQASSPDSFFLTGQCPVATIYNIRREGLAFETCQFLAESIYWLLSFLCWIPDQVWNGGVDEFIIFVGKVSLLRPANL